MIKKELKVEFHEEQKEKNQNELYKNGLIVRAGDLLAKSEEYIGKTVRVVGRFHHILEVYNSSAISLVIRRPFKIRSAHLVYCVLVDIVDQTPAILDFPVSSKDYKIFDGKLVSIEVEVEKVRGFGSHFVRMASVITSGLFGGRPVQLHLKSIKEMSEVEVKNLTNTH